LGNELKAHPVMEPSRNTFHRIRHGISLVWFDTHQRILSTLQFPWCRSHYLFLAKNNVTGQTRSPRQSTPDDTLYRKVHLSRSRVQFFNLLNLQKQNTLKIRLLKTIFLWWQTV